MSRPGHGATPLVICSKSAWRPAIRREHSLAMLAAGHGHPVTFLERPLDVRALGSRAGAREWWAGLSGRARPAAEASGVRVMPHATVLPGHLGAASETSSNMLLRRALSRVAPRAAVVVNVPWQWPATSAHRGRRVFDCADDWSVLMSARNERMAELYRQIAREADAVVVANRSLAEHFPGERTVVVRNGVSEEMLGPLAAPVRALRMVQASTLTPRFDCELAASLLRALPEWTLELYGQCQYPGCGERPGPELARLLEEYAPQVSWHGVLERQALSAAIDRSAVALVLNRPELSLGQDSMKLYDYAARGRPIVTTAFSPRVREEGPPHLRVCEDPGEMAGAIVSAREEPAQWRGERRRWAERQRWQTRWPEWSRAVFGASD